MRSECHIQLSAFQHFNEFRGFIPGRSGEGQARNGIPGYEIDVYIESFGKPCQFVGIGFAGVDTGKKGRFERYPFSGFLIVVGDGFFEFRQGIGPCYRHEFAAEGFIRGGKGNGEPDIGSIVGE